MPRHCAHNMQWLCETTCDARTSTIDHQVMLDYHIPLGYFVLTLVILLDPIEGNGSNGSLYLLLLTGLGLGKFVTDRWRLDSRTSSYTSKVLFVQTGSLGKHSRHL